MATIPPLSKKKRTLAQVGADSLVAAIAWDKLIPELPNELKETGEKMAKVDTVVQQTLKHLAGRHSQARHGFRFGAGKGPKEGLSEEDKAAYEQRLAKRGGGKAPGGWAGLDTSSYPKNPSDWDDAAVNKATLHLSNRSDADLQKMQDLYRAQMGRIYDKIDKRNPDPDLDQAYRNLQAMDDIVTSARSLKLDVENPRQPGHPSTRTAKRTGNYSGYAKDPADMGEGDIARAGRDFSDRFSLSDLKGMQKSNLDTLARAENKAMQNPGDAAFRREADNQQGVASILHNAVFRKQQQIANASQTAVDSVRSFSGSGAHPTYELQIKLPKVMSLPLRQRLASILGAGGQGVDLTGDTWNLTFNTNTGAKAQTAINFLTKVLAEEPISIPGKKEATENDFAGETLQVYKDDSGTYRWVTLSSNAFRDRDKEIISMAALETDIERSEKDHDYGPLRWWHVPGADLGDCDTRVLLGKVLVESGTFRSKEIAEAVQEAAPDLQISIGFNHPATEPDREGVFNSIRTFERSLLPAGRAANPWTYLKTKGVNTMASFQEKLKALGQVLKDPELLKHVLERAAKVEAEATKAGADFKEADEGAEAPLPPEMQTDFDELLAKWMPEAAKESEGEGAAEGAAETKDETTLKQPENETADAEAEQAAAATEEMGEEESEEMGEEVYLSELTVGEFAEMLATALDEVFSPYFDKLDAIAGMMQAPAAPAATPPPPAPPATQNKESSESGDTRMAELEAENKRMKEMVENLPKALRRAFIASQDESTVLKEESETDKELLAKAPGKANPIDGFITDFVLGNSGNGSKP